MNIFFPFSLQTVKKLKMICILSAPTPKWFFHQWIINCLGCQEYLTTLWKLAWEVFVLLFSLTYSLLKFIFYLITSFAWKIAKWPQTAPGASELLTVTLLRNWVLKLIFLRFPKDKNINYESQRMLIPWTSLFLFYSCSFLELFTQI